MNKYRVVLAGRNEAVEYEDETGVYRFAVVLEGKVWRVSLPPTKGSSFKDFALSPELRRTILPRVQEFLSRIRWLGIWPVNYTVAFDE